MTAKANKISETQNQTVWLIEWPSSPFKMGKSYYAGTYPNSELLHIETAAKRRTANVSDRVRNEIRLAIASA